MIEITKDQARHFNEYMDIQFYYHPMHYLENYRAIVHFVSIIERKGDMTDELRDKIKAHLYSGSLDLALGYIIKIVCE